MNPLPLLLAPTVWKIRVPLCVCLCLEGMPTVFGQIWNLARLQTAKMRHFANGSGKWPKGGQSGPILPERSVEKGI